ncbi:hypothetical protein XH88_36405 [Bradyrhizobium sp. CCBAU 51627]|nr:hypothetical protein [Bradyrhizobium sp. CCBAU 51627]
MDLPIVRNSHLLSTVPLNDRKITLAPSSASRLTMMTQAGLTLLIELDRSMIDLLIPGSFSF